MGKKITSRQKKEKRRQETKHSCKKSQNGKQKQRQAKYATWGQGNKKTNTEYQGTVQTTEGSHEARLTADNSNSCPIQGKTDIARYSISEPPYAMRNIPKYYITKKLQERHVLKFDIRNPDTCRKLCY